MRAFTMAICYFQEVPGLEGPHVTNYTIPAWVLQAPTRNRTEFSALQERRVTTYTLEADLTTFALDSHPERRRRRGQ